MKSPSNPGLRRTYVNLKKANWDRYRQEVEAALSKRSLPTDCQRDEKIFRTILLKAASHHIPTGRHRLHEEPVPAEILDVMNRRDDLRKRDPTSPELPRMNKDIQNRICVHKRQKWRDFVETMDQKTDVTKLWRTIKGIDGRAKREAENVAITFNGISFSSSKQLATKFNQQFNTSKLGSHTSSRETRVVTREAKRKSLEMAQSFTSDLVMKAIKSCRNSKAFGPDKLSIFHLKHLGPRAIEYITALFNLSVTTCQIPAIWKSSLIIPIPKPSKDTSQGTSYRPISLLCPAAKVMESLLLPTINKFLLPAQDQHGFRREHSTTSALLQLTTDIAGGFNQRKPPDRTVCVAVDLSAAFDTVCHNNLLSNINRSQFPPATARWLSCYMRGRQAKTCFRGVKSTSMKVNTGVPQGSRLSPSLFSFYIADMPRPTDPVKRVCYADDLTVWASGVHIPDLEVSLNNYLEELTTYLKDNSLLISAPKSSVTLLTRTHTKPRPILIYSLRIHASRWLNAQRYWGVYLDPSLSFNKHSQYVAERVSGRNNILKALAGTSWGQQKETLLMTYKAVGRSIINYAAPVWSPNLHDTNYRKIQYTQNEALRIATGCHKMSSVDHLHTEADMLKVREHSELLSAQYLARYLEPGNVCHPITTRAAPERRMKETLYTKHRNTVEPMMVKNDRKATLQALHTDAVDKAVRSQERNVVLDGRPPPISSSEKELSRRERSTLAQLRSGHCRLLGSYKSRIKKDASLNVCSDCGTSPHDVTHLFTCPAHPTTMIPSDLWNRPTDIVRELNYLEARDPN